jgi:hypothetical protein
MTTITLPRAVVEQALEALVSENSLSAVAMQQRMDALRALKTALAQQAEPVEPVAWMHNILEDNIIRHRPADLKRSPQNWTPLCNCAQPQQSDTDCHTQGICQRSGYDITQQAEPVEPVACIDALKDAFFEGFTSVATYNDTLLNSPEEAWEKYKPPHTAPPQRAEPVLQTCNCRWDGEVQVQQCTLHEAHVDAIHEWAERAKTAEKKLAALAQQAEPQTTHSTECWRWHHKCAVAKIERECKHE